MIESPTLQQNIQTRSSSVDLLLVLRGIACMMVVLAHAWTFVPKDRIDHILQIGSIDLSGIIRGNGAIGVWIFFVLSGYLMGKGFWTRRYQANIQGARSFYTNRALRIVPLYLLVIGVNILLFNRELLASQAGTLLQLLLFRYNGASELGPLWSISTEVQFYLLAPVLAWVLVPWLTTRKKSVYIAGGLICAYVIFALYLRNFGQWDYNYYWNSLYIPIWANLPLFMFGFMLNSWMALDLPHKPPLSRKMTTRIFLACGVLIVFGGSWCGYYLGRSPHEFIREESLLYLPIPVGLLAAGLIYLSERSDAGIRRGFPSWQALRLAPLRMFEWFGILTYGIYLWHTLLLTFMARHFQPQGSSLAIIATTFAVLAGGAILLSAITYALVERPCERLKIGVKSP
ncbi:MAG: acyltransferase family protein [Armatimonadota bacterium]